MRALLFCVSFFVAGYFVCECFGDDVEITRTIQASILRAKGNGVARDFHVDFVVTNGQVAVSGRCGNAATMRRLVNLMRYTPGVVRVENTIVVVNSSPAMKPMALVATPARGFEPEPTVVRRPRSEAEEAAAYSDEPANETLPPVISADVQVAEQTRRRSIRFPSFAERREQEDSLAPIVIKPVEPPATLPQIVEKPHYDRPVEFRAGRPKAPVVAPPQPPRDVAPPSEQLTAPVSPADATIQPASIDRSEQAKVAEPEIETPQLVAPEAESPQLETPPTEPIQPVLIVEQPAPAIQPAPAPPAVTLNTQASDWIATAPPSAFTTSEPAEVAPILEPPTMPTPEVEEASQPIAEPVESAPERAKTSLETLLSGVLAVSDWSQIGWIMISLAAGVFVVTRLFRKSS